MGRTTPSPNGLLATEVIFIIELRLCSQASAEISKFETQDTVMFCTLRKKRKHTYLTSIDIYIAKVPVFSTCKYHTSSDMIKHSVISCNLASATQFTLNLQGSCTIVEL